jgi:hypothetical protein
MQSIYNLKLQEEKKNTSVKSSKGKVLATLKGGGTKGQDTYDRNNNNAMISDVMGADDYGDYGDEGAGFKREGEAEFDFM